MNLNGYELQLFVSALVVLGCALVALIVDYLKGNNEKLRESHIDLLARQATLSEQATNGNSVIMRALSEHAVALRELIDRPIQVVSAAPSVTLAPVPVTEIPEPRREAVAEAIVEEEKIKVALIADSQVAAPEPVVAYSEPVLEEVAVAAEVVEEVPAEEVLPANVIRIRLVPEIQRLVAKLEEAPETVEEVEVEAVVEEAVAVAPVSEPVLIDQLLQMAESVMDSVAANDPVAEESPVPQIAAEFLVIDGTTVPGPVEASFDTMLDDMVSEFDSNPAVYAEIPAQEQPSMAALADPEPLQGLSLLPLIPALGFQTNSELMADEPDGSNLEQFTPNLEVPAGTHEVSVLNSLLERNELLTGLVVCVGINEYDQIHENLGRAAADELLRSVDSLMSSLASEDGFCTRKSQDEFILVFAKLSGPAAQRRLSELSERLWDFQLRNLGTFSVVFSWGATEAQREKLTDAIGSATERMVETQSSRKTVGLDRNRRRRATA